MGYIVTCGFPAILGAGNDNTGLFPTSKTDTPSGASRGVPQGSISGLILFYLHTLGLIMKKEHTALVHHNETANVHPLFSINGETR